MSSYLSSAVSYSDDDVAYISAIELEQHSHIHVNLLNGWIIFDNYKFCQEFIYYDALHIGTYTITRYYILALMFCL